MSAPLEIYRESFEPLFQEPYDGATLVNNRRPADTSNCPPVLVAITGGQGAGKSTLARLLVALLAGDASLYEGISRKVEIGGHRLGENANDATILAFAAEHLRREGEAPSGRIAVLDRCLFDLHAYATVVATKPVRDLTARLAKAARYDLTILVPTPIERLHLDGRDEDASFRFRLSRLVAANCRTMAGSLLIAPEEFDPRSPFVEKVASRLKAEADGRDA